MTAAQASFLSYANIDCFNFIHMPAIKHIESKYSDIETRKAKELLVVLLNEYLKSSECLFLDSEISELVSGNYTDLSWLTNQELNTIIVQSFPPLILFIVYDFLPNLGLPKILLIC